MTTSYFFSGFCPLRKLVQYICTAKMYRTSHLITHGIGICLPAPQDIPKSESSHIGSTCHSCIQSNPTICLKTVQNFSFLKVYLPAGSLYQLGKKPGLLTIYHIDQIVHAIFRDLHLCIKCFPNKSFQLRKSFFPALIGVTSLIDSTEVNTVLFQYPFLIMKRILLLDCLHTECQTSAATHILILVNHQFIFLSTFPENHTTGSVSTVISGIPRHSLHAYEENSR